MFEFVFEVVAEALIQVGGELVYELWRRALRREPGKAPWRDNPWVIAGGYALAGTILGGLSLLVLPFHLVSSSVMRGLNLLFVPVAVGFLVMALGAWWKGSGERMRVERFWCGYVFALTFAIVRLWFGR